MLFITKTFNFLDEKHLIISAIGCIIRLVKIIFGGFKNESELEKDFNGRYPFKCFRGFTYCLWWRRKTKAENESGSANKAAGDVKLWVDTEYMGVFKKLSPILKTPILKLT